MDLNSFTFSFSKTLEYFENAVSFYSILKDNPNFFGKTFENHEKWYYKIRFYTDKEFNFSGSYSDILENMLCKQCTFKGPIRVFIRGLLNE